ncbi:hypothetical protein [Nocardia sp. NPDC024068]|uniref:hypothetical protein n=1 Tax=Nocardia sp. NPDC024068 TaxID=3157197 RepID=UPI0033D91C7C
MTYLKLIPEIQCWPTWIRDRGLFDNVDPDSLGITTELAIALHRWSDVWDSTYDLVNDPGNPKFPSEDSERTFWREGAELAHRLRGELGPGWSVEYSPESRYPDALLCSKTAGA